MADISATSRRSVAFSGFSSAFTFNETVNADNSLQFSVSLAAAKVGTLSTRTDANTGILTMAASHGFTDAAMVDVYWDGGTRRNMTIGTVATNSVPIDGGVGDDLPAATTAITAMIPHVETFLVTGDDVVGILLGGDRGGQFLFTEADGTTVVASASVVSGTSYIYLEGVDDTNILASGDVGEIHFSHGDSTAARTVRGAVLFN